MALIEHKSYVDYDVSMQLLRYMVCIWYDWMKMGGNAAEHKKKEFRYPPVIPIVYYEGTREWTVGMRLKDRILFGDLFKEYIPDFTYRVVENRRYTRDELLTKENEMALLMLLNQIQTPEDIDILKALPMEKLNQMIRNSSEAVLNEIVRAVQGLCRCLNLTEEETAEYTQKVKERDMGYLWENAEKMDIQAERRNTAEARKEAEEAGRKLRESVKMLIGVFQQAGADSESVCTALSERLGLSAEEAASMVAEYTQKVKERDMGYLWENAEKMDIQAERRNTAEARKELAEAQKELAETEKNAEEMQKKLHNMYRVLIQAYRQQGFDRETVRKRMINETDIEDVAAKELLDQYWDEPKIAK